MQRQGFNVAGIGDLLAGVMAAGDAVYLAANVSLTTSQQTVFSFPTEQGVSYGFLVLGHLSVAGAYIAAAYADITGGSDLTAVTLIANNTAATLNSSSAAGAGSQLAGASFATGNPRGFAFFGTARKAAAAGNLEISMTCSVAAGATLLAGSAGYCWRLR